MTFQGFQRRDSLSGENNQSRGPQSEMMQPLLLPGSVALTGGLSVSRAQGHHFCSSLTEETGKT